MIQRGDLLGVQRVPGNKVHDAIAEGTYSETVHIAIALSATRCMEMHLGGLRTVRISRHKKIRVFRPPTQLQNKVTYAIDSTYDHYQHARYGFWQGIAQGLKRKFGFWLPFRKKDVANCSEVGAYYAEVVGCMGIGDENKYDPGKLVDHVFIKGWHEISQNNGP